MVRLVLAVVLGLLVATIPSGAGGAGEAPRPAPRAPACSSGQVSLTFDDGPSPTATPRLVKMLRDLRVPATFFMVGERAAAAPRIARQVSRSGFLVANHSFRHESMTGQSSAAVRATLRATQRRLRAVGARPSRLMRPPYGAIDARVRRAVADVGLVPVLWDVDPRDWEGASSAVIAQRILAGLRPGRRNIVLQHDGIRNSPASIGAVPRVVREARRRGYCFVALDDRGRPGFPVPDARLSAVSAPEGRAARAVVSLDRPTARTTRVRLRTAAGSAETIADFAARDTVVRIPAGRTRAVVRIPLRRDRLDERSERFGLTLTEAFGVRLVSDRATVRIADRSRAPRVSITDLTVEEPVTGATTSELVVTLDRRSGRTVRLHLVDVPGTADHDDYEPLDLVATVPAGQRRVRVPLTVHADLVDEPEEAFRVRLVRATRAEPADRTGRVTITPPPAPPG